MVQELFNRIIVSGQNLPNHQQASEALQEIQQVQERRHDIKVAKEFNNQSNIAGSEYAFRKTQNHAVAAPASRLNQLLQQTNNIAGEQAEASITPKPINNPASNIVTETVKISAKPTLAVPIIADNNTKNASNNLEVDEFYQASQTLNVLKHNLQSLFDKGDSKTSGAVALKAQIQHVESDLLLLQLRYQQKQFDARIEQSVNRKIKDRQIDEDENSNAKQKQNVPAQQIKDQLNILIEQRAAVFLLEGGDFTSFDEDIARLKFDLQQAEQRNNNKNAFSLAQNNIEAPHIEADRLLSARDIQAERLQQL